MKSRRKSVAQTVEKPLAKEKLDSPDLSEHMVRKLLAQGTGHLDFREVSQQAIEKSLAKEEWDFHDVPEDELQECFVIEYFRELPLYAGFPTPYQCLSKRQKKQRFAEFRKRGIDASDQFMFFGPSHFGIDQFLPPGEAGFGIWGTLRRESMLLLRHPKEGTEIIGEFVIDWRLPDTKIADQIRNWLKRYRPPETSAHRRGSKDISIRVSLERLGIMRLLHHYSIAEIRQYLPEAWTRLFQPPKYERPRDFYKERKWAREAFDRLFPRPFNKELIPRSWFTKHERTKVVTKSSRFRS